MAESSSGLLATLAAPAAWAYGKVIAARNARYDAGLNIHKLDRPVISVGNITVGGTGKSPTVLWIVRELRNAGRQPVIAMRGYGTAPGEKNDEQLEYEWRQPDVPVVADPDRYTALTNYIAAHPHIDCVVLDDGFQHRKLHRDLDVVMIDASTNTLHDSLLPAGRLREPVTSLRRADAVVITRTSSVNNDLATAVQAVHGRAPIAWSQHTWSNLFVIHDGCEHPEPIDWLLGKSIITMLGVGNPTSIENQLLAAGATITARIHARDHERYDRAKIITARGLCTGVDALVLTAKDWVKVRSLVDSNHWPCPIIVPMLDISMHSGADRMRELIQDATR